MISEHENQEPRRTGPRTHRGEPRTIHALTFDVEEWFHAANLAVPRDRWSELPARLPVVIPDLLDLLEQHHVKATFFVVGWLARTSPAIVRQIADEGHEIASHSYWHRSVVSQSRQQFRDDLILSKQVLEDAIGEPVIGYRAPSYSIPAINHWAFEELRRAGFLYDSSVYPVRAPHGRYGIPNARTCPHRIDQDLWEFPLPILKVLGLRFPAATGAYLRLAPLCVTERTIRSYERRSLPAVINIHPWELDPNPPRWPAPAWKRFLHYANLHTTKGKLDRLLRRFRFAPLRSILRRMAAADALPPGIEKQRTLQKTPVTLGQTMEPELMGESLRVFSL